MIKRLILRFRDMKTISKLITGADEQAHLLGREEPGAEHFVLSSLNLDDGSARRVFEKLNVNAQKYKDAISQQYADALSSIGIANEPDLNPEPLKSKKVFQGSQPSANELMKSLHALKKKDKDRPLLAAHVLNVASEMEHGVVARAFKVLGIEREQLSRLISQELNS